MSDRRANGPASMARCWRSADAIFLVLALLAAAQIGCASSKFLTRQQVQDGPWRSFEEVKAAFEQIVPGSTTLEELTALRFAPGSSQASKLINYIDVRRFFVPHEGISIDDANEGVRRCVDLQQRCTAWRIALNRERKKRIGNVALDWLLFRRITRTTGWRFDALILIEDERVLYTIWSGVPAVLSFRDRIRPLGFLQESARIIPPIFSAGSTSGTP